MSLAWQAARARRERAQVSRVSLLCPSLADLCDLRPTITRQRSRPLTRASHLQISASPFAHLFASRLTCPRSRPFFLSTTAWIPRSASQSQQDSCSSSQPQQHRRAAKPRWSSGRCLGVGASGRGGCEEDLRRREELQARRGGGKALLWCRNWIGDDTRSIPRYSRGSRLDEQEFARFGQQQCSKDAPTDPSSTTAGEEIVRCDEDGAGRRRG